ncbi:hypothetical protein [Nocardiopsis kunsanensis]|uniref:hypothetical protein n=1 Tax=Nocardiopsis kunsanensis TaxID=141693 RepID=UPI00373AF037
MAALEAIAEQLCLYLADRDRVLAENVLYFAGVHQPDLRPLSRRWVHGMTTILSNHTSPAAARATAVYMDGAVLYALLNDTPPGPGGAARGDRPRAVEHTRSISRPPPGPVSVRICLGRENAPRLTWGFVAHPAGFEPATIGLEVRCFAVSWG